jgi:hypothetical protein
MRSCLFAVLLLLTACNSASLERRSSQTLRFATYNSSLYADQDGGLIARLQAGDDKARRIAAVIQHQRPDVLLLNEFDYDAGQRAADLFQTDYLEIGQFGERPIRYPFRFLAPVNTGEPSGLDLDNDGHIGGPEDAYGFGRHSGQYGMLVLSRFPIDAAAVRTFQNFLWKDLPGAKRPIDPKTGKTWYAPQEWERLRLSSKSHWDVPILTPLGTIHFLVDHPTPPVFDGPEDRNGTRNFGEIRLWAEYLSPENKPWLCDDAGRCGGLSREALFVIAGDHNADPIDGAGVPGAMNQLLQNPRVLPYAAPTSAGAVASAQRAGGANLTQRGPPERDTGDFGPTVGNLRLDYILPSVGLRIERNGVFWPLPGDPGNEWIGATDHRMVWVDLSR